MAHNGVCCFTGHRDFEERATKNQRSYFEKLVYNCARMGYTTFVAGGALGFDTAAAEMVLKMRREGIPVLAATRAHTMTPDHLRQYFLSSER